MGASIGSVLLVAGGRKRAATPLQYYMRHPGPQEANTWGHMFGHVVEGLIFTLLLWGIGSVVYLVAGGRKRAASVDSPLQ